LPGWANAAIAVACGLLAGALLLPVVLPWLHGGVRLSPVGNALKADLAATPQEGLARFYQADGYRPLWVKGKTIRSDAQGLIAVLRAAGANDLDPSKYGASDLSSVVAAAADGKPASLADAELALSRAYVMYVDDLHRPAKGAALAFIDPAVRLPPLGAEPILRAAQRQPSMDAALKSAEQMNPLYLALRQAWTAARAKDPASSSAALLRINLERTRALPVDLGPRYILVNPAAEHLWMYADGKPQADMRVVVGKLTEPTPSMIGLARYALFNPYWNIPPDLVRDKVAPAVLKDGLGSFTGQRFQALDSFKPNAAVLDPAKIDWMAVASGAQILRVRQLPGPHNMMGTVKFMLPNRLGIYLHDTPMRGLFAGAERTDSAGCVRLQNPAQMAAWLFGRPQSFNPNGPPDQRVNLPRPVPVYILYLTVQPSASGVTVLPDIYSRDPALISAMAAPTAR